MKKLLKIVLSVFLATALAIQLPVNVVSVVNAEDADTIEETTTDETVEETVVEDDEEILDSSAEESEEETEDSNELKYTDEDGNVYYYYKLSDSEITITNCRAVSANLIVPSTIDGYTVTSIEEYAFEINDSLVTVILPDTLVTIGEGAFADCDNLTSISIPASVTSIGEYVFYYCGSLKEIIVDENNSVYSSVDGVLFNKDQTTLILYPSDKADASYTIPEGVTSVSKNAFSFNYNITEVIFPNSMTTIDARIFDYCENLKTVEIPASITYIEDGSWGVFGARDCPYLESINVAEDNTAYSSIDGVLFNKDQTILICYPAGKTETSYVIPTGVTTIREEAFAFSHLTSIEIPDTVTTIESLAFYISNIESFTIPTSVTSIGDMAFFTSNVDYVNLYVYEGSYAHEYVKEHYFAEQYVVLENTTATVTSDPTEDTTTNTSTTNTTSSDSTTTDTSTVSNVQTGDESQLVAYALLGGIALAGVYFTRKKKYN